jgi:hypothetical protein
MLLAKLSFCSLSPHVPTETMKVAVQTCDSEWGFSSEELTTTIT